MRELNPKISVALCTYNGARFLREQLESIAAQTRRPDELVVGDDCSTDETIAILREFAARVKFPIRIHVNSSNLGSTKNFERTILRCAGDLIFLSDQDDVWLPHKIAAIAREFEQSSAVGMIFSDAELVDEDLQPLDCNLFAVSFRSREQKLWFKRRPLEVLFSRNVVTGATAAFRREFTNLFAPIPTDIPNTIHDHWIALVIAANARIKFLPEQLIKYRQHSAQQLGIDWQPQNQKTDNKQKRFAAYARSIRLYKNENERLDKTLRLIETLPQFARSRSEWLESLINIANRKRKLHGQIIKHYQSRGNLLRANENRLNPILRELLSGRYHRFSKGFLSAAKDLLQK